MQNFEIRLSVNFVKAGYPLQVSRLHQTEKCTLKITTLSLYSRPLRSC